MERFFTKRLFVLIVVLLFLPVFMYGQEVHYSPLPGHNTGSTSFEVIGKYNGQRLIYMKNYDDRRIVFFNKAMKPEDTIALTVLPSELTDLHFIDLQSGFIMLYQYEHRRDIICKAVLFDGSGKMRSQPHLIDKTVHPLRIVGDVAYSHVLSKDKSRILIYKTVRQQNEELLTLTTFLLDSSLSLLQKGKVLLPRKAEDPGPVQIKLSGDGGLYLVYGSKGFSYQPYFENITIFYKPAFVDKLVNKSIFFKGSLPGDRMLLTIDENGQRLWLTAFNFDARQRHFIGLTTWQLGMDSLHVLRKSRQEFEAGVRKSLAEKRNRRKAVFDYYVPCRLIFSRSGEALLVAEKQFIDGEGHTQYGDIGLFNLDENGKLVLIQQISREAGQYGHADLGSFLVVNRSRALHFLLNQSHDVTRFLSSSIYLLRDYRYLGNKKLQPMPVMKNMDKGYKWLPSMGKQISYNEVIIPCLSGGNLLFGAITY